MSSRNQKSWQHLGGEAHYFSSYSLDYDTQKKSRIPIRLLLWKNSTKLF